ncbi:MAG: short-chain dehydrogenase [Chloroflexi bacterium]|nr:short-chain dehydrogenase [Chloroflexota bacterium]|tara:strand:+ start:1692 stop:2453 length:762 start_codon:yes stop_codon:yes gene_type:complete
MRLEKKKVLITGGGSGIGQACTKLFLDEGAQVIVTDVNNQNLKNTKKLLKNYDFETVEGDVSLSSDAKYLVNFTTDKLGKIDILVNSAGVTQRNAPSEFDFEQTWDWVININLKGTYLMSWFTVEEMKKNRGGSILNMASIIGLVGYNKKISNGLNPYPHSKGGVIQMTRDMAVGLAEYNIRVNALCPGFTKTKLTQDLLKDEKILSDLESLHPMGRLANPDEIANAALFLSSDEASFITGVCLPVDGGYTAQ